MKKYIYNTYDNSKGFNHFSGNVKGGKEIIIIDLYQIDESPKPKELLNNLEFNTLNKAINTENNIF